MPDPTPDPPPTTPATPAKDDLDTLRHRLGDLQARLTVSDEIIASLERRQKIDAHLAQSDVVDLEVARLLTEAAVTQMDEPDVALAVKDLRRDKPYLFRDRPSPGASAMSERFDFDPLHDQADTAARAAAGDKRALDRYLRLRRSSR